MRVMEGEQVVYKQVSSWDTDDVIAWIKGIIGSSIIRYLGGGGEGGQWMYAQQLCVVKEWVSINGWKQGTCCTRVCMA